jgi:hypothetical protein
MLEDDPDLDQGNWRKLNRREEKRTKKSWKEFTQAIIGKCLCPGSRVESRFSRKRHGRKHGKRA